jgi:hypothetical protein
MRVVVPYRPGMLFRRTYDAAKAWEGGCEFVELRNANEPVDDRPTYPELLADLWDAGQGVIMLEHDVVPYEDSLAAIASCPEPWCGYGYPDGGGFKALGVNLGCTKLSSELMAATAEWGPLERKERRWGHCDIRLYWYAFYLGIKAHRHYPDVAHRGTRHDHPDHNRKHPLGDDYIELDEHGEPLGDPQPPYESLRKTRPDFMPAATYDPADELTLTLRWIQDLAPSSPTMTYAQRTSQQIRDAMLGRGK